MHTDIFQWLLEPARPPRSPQDVGAAPAPIEGGMLTLGPFGVMRRWTPRVYQETHDWGRLRRLPLIRILAILLLAFAALFGCSKRSHDLSAKVLSFQWADTLVTATILFCNDGSQDEAILEAAILFARTADSTALNTRFPLRRYNHDWESFVLSPGGKALRVVSHRLSDSILESPHIFVLFRTAGPSSALRETYVHTAHLTPLLNHVNLGPYAPVQLGTKKRFASITYPLAFPK